MKKSLNILLVLCATQLMFAQIAIGKAAISNIPLTTTPNPNISLEFGDYVAGQGKGIVLPWATSTTAVTNSVNGTLLFDTFDKIVKLKNGTNSYFNLSRNETTTVGTTPNFDTTGVVNTTLQNNLDDLPDAKVNIGATNNTNTPGILVLESSSQAMILPKLPSPHLNIINPEPGTIAYDTITKQLAVFNGKVWSFWKP